jgi:hypothetical protein
MTARPKAPKPVRSEPYRRLVAALPCINCTLEGFSQAAHPNAGKAKGLKACDLACFPLCSVAGNDCHRKFDQYEYGTSGYQAELEEEWTARTQFRLVCEAENDSSIRRVLRAIGGRLTKARNE